MRFLWISCFFRFRTTGDTWPIPHLAASMRTKSVLPACSCRPTVLPAAARLLSTSSAATSLQPRTHTHPSTDEQLKDLQDLLNRYPATPTWSRRITGTLADLEQPRSARIAGQSIFRGLVGVCAAEADLDGLSHWESRMWNYGSRDCCV